MRMKMASMEVDLEDAKAANWLGLGLGLGFGLGLGIYPAFGTTLYHILDCLNWPSGA